MNPKMNLCEVLLRRSVENQFRTHRHNKKEDEKLERKFSLFYRQISLIDRHIHMAQRRCESHGRNDLGLLITCKRRPLESSLEYPFYYTSTQKNRTTKEYFVSPLHQAVNHKNMYEFVFERRSNEYIEEMQQKRRTQINRKRQFLEHIEEITDDWNGNWPLTDNARLRLPPIVQSKNLSKVHFAMDI